VTIATRANERTFLAWVRTGIADAVDSSRRPPDQWLALNNYRLTPMRWGRTYPTGNRDKGWASVGMAGIAGIAGPVAGVIS
jgi:Domain of unknown function (DUF202)